MANSELLYEKPFVEWLSNTVKPSQRAAIYLAIHDINNFCLDKRILTKPLYNTDDLHTLAKVKETVESNKVFSFNYKKRKKEMVAAIQYYYQFIKERNKTNPNTSTVVAKECSKSVESSNAVVPSFYDLLNSKGIPYIDNLSKNGCLWIIGGEELSDFVKDCSTYGITFHYKSDGTRRTENKPAWWTKDQVSMLSTNKSIVLLPSKDNNSQEPDEPSSEIDKLLNGPLFLPLRKALAENNVRTVEDLKSLQLWKFMNQNNIYSIPVRQEVLLKVRELLFPVTNADPKSLYKLHCGGNVYYGETPSKAFVRFCEDIASKYPLMFRSILDRKIGDNESIYICRLKKNDRYLKIENPTCYISADLTQDDVIYAVSWIWKKCDLSDGKIYIEMPQDSSMKNLNEQLSLVDDKVNSNNLSAPGTEEILLDFTANEPLAYTKPCSFTYFEESKEPCSSWAELYVNFFAAVHEDYPHKFMPGMSFSESSERVDLIEASNAGKMIAPKIVPGTDFAIETNYSADRVVRKMAYIMDYCAIDYENIIVKYCRNRAVNNSGITSSGANKATTSGATNSHNSNLSTQAGKSFISAQTIAKVEKIILDADLTGVTFDDLYNTLNLSMRAIKEVVSKSEHIVAIKDRLYCEDAFIDWEDGANRLYDIIKKLMQKNDGYVSSAQLYDYAHVELSMFLNDNGMDDERSVYEIAQHLFEKNSYRGSHYSFNGKSHISSSSSSIESNFDIFCKYAEDKGGVFREEDLIEYLNGIGIKTGNLHTQMRMYKEPYFFFYDVDMIIFARSMQINETWKERVKLSLNKLFDDVGDHIILREIHLFWFKQLPDLPGNISWTPLLLQSILRFYSNELGAKTIPALETQSLNTLHAMLVTNDSPIQNFGDAVISYLIESETEQRSFEAEELRQLLVKTGMIQGNELIWNMPKALAKDERFAWNATGEKVTIRV